MASALLPARRANPSHMNTRFFTPLLVLFAASASAQSPGAPRTTLGTVSSAVANPPKRHTASEDAPSAKPAGRMTRRGVSAPRGSISKDPWEIGLSNGRACATSANTVEHKFQEEIEIGLPIACKLNLSPGSPMATAARASDVAFELRWALADWGKSPNPTPTPSIKSSICAGPDVYELKLLGEEFAPHSGG